MKKLLIYCLLILQCLVSFSQERFTSPDGKKTVLINRLPNGKYQVIANSSAHNYYKRIMKNQIYFFTDSFKVAYIAKCESGYCIIIDGIEGPHYKKIIKNEIKFSPDRTHYAYMAQTNQKFSYIIDGEEQPEYDGIMTIGITFSPDSRHWAYAALNNNKWFYIIDGIKEPEYDGIISTGITFSPDSKHWAYAVLNNEEWFYIVNGIEQPHYKQVAANGIIFSADSKHWAYGAEKDNKWICISDGKEPPHEDSDLCSSYDLPTTSPSIDNSYFEIGFVSCQSESLMATDSDFQGEDITLTYTNNGAVLLPKLTNNYGFSLVYGAQSIYKKFGTGMEFNYTLLFPEATWNSVDVKVKYYSFFDCIFKFMYLPAKRLSFDLSLGLNLSTRMKIEDGSFTLDNDGNILSTDDAKLKGGIIRGFPFNVLGGIGVSYKITPKLIISANTYARYVLFTRATGAMGKNKKLKSSGFLYGGIMDWVNDPNLNFQFSTRFLLD
jgi:hypothetical protein